jgi:PKD repeat protein
MRNKLLILIVGIILLFGSKSLLAGGNSCVAGFNYSIDTDVSYFTYLFHSTSSPSSTIVGYSWDFGDGGMSEQQNPEHQFLSAGIYIVSLTITCSDGSNDSFSDTLDVKQVAPSSCFANFSSKWDTLQANYTFQFTDHSVCPGDTIVSWIWDFGDGSSVLGVQHPQHQYISSNTYLVTLTIVTSQFCTSTYSDTVYASPNQPQCNADFLFFQDSSSGIQELINFYDYSCSCDSIVSYFWDFSDGDTSIAQDPVHIFPNPGVYDVSLSIQTVSGCSSSIHYPIQVGNPQKYNLWGRVYLGNLTTDQCVAMLYKEYNNGYIVPIDTVRLTSVNDTLGVYYFYQVLEGIHKVKVILPESSNYDGFYAPTYYGDNLFWNTTSLLNLNADLSLMNVNMQPVVQQSGNCQLGGSVVMNNSPVGQEGVQVLLLNNNFNVYAYTFTNTMGEYAFEDVPQGDYQVYAEVTGLYSTPAQISFSSASDTIGNVNVYLSKTNSMVSIDQDIEIDRFMTMMVFPNPAYNSISIRISQELKQELKFQIYNNLGQLVDEGNIENRGHITSINIANLYSGLYLLKVFSKDGTFVAIKKFIHN